jgi:hypothetical protein
MFSGSAECAPFRFCRFLPPFVACMRATIFLSSLGIGERQIMRWVAAFLITGSLLFLAGCLTPPSFQGGQLAKSRGPFLSRLYMAQFRELDLNKNGQYSISFSDFPASAVWLDIDLIGRTERDRKAVVGFTSEVLMELATENGSQVCKARGELNKIRGVADHHWVLSGSGNSASLWDSDCLQLKLRKSRSYTLRITVTGATEASGPLRAQPRLYTPCC